MNYNHLYYYYVTCKLQNVSRAAEFLRISQPALSVQLKTLETQLGKKLLRKTGRKLEMTADGNQTYLYCQRIFEAADDLKKYLESPTNTNYSKKITIGISQQIDSPFAADLLSEVFWDEDSGRPTISIVSGTQEELNRLLSSQQIDLVLTNSPLYGQDIYEQAQVKAPVTAVISRDYQRLVAKKTLNQILSESEIQFIFPSGKQKLRYETDLFFQTQKIRKSIALESDILSIVTRAAVDGLGIAFLPVSYVSEELYHKLLIDLNPRSALWYHSIYLFSRKAEDDTYKKIAKEFKSLELNANFYKKHGSKKEA